MTDRTKADMDSGKPWLSGEPYYCAECGAGGPERMACEEPFCQLETKEVAEARRAKALGGET